MNIDRINLVALETILNLQMPDISNRHGKNDPNIGFLYISRMYDMKTELFSTLKSYKNSYISVIQYDKDKNLIFCLSFRTNDCIDINTCPRIEIVLKQDLTGYYIYKIVNNTSRLIYEHKTN